MTIIAQEIVNHRLTVPVHDVPIYPGKITGDQWQYIKGVKTIFRSFNIEQEDTAKITKWYEENLAKSPWTFVEVNSYSYSEYGEIHIEYCIQATRTIENEEHVYFWEFRGGNDRSRGVHINIGTPHPITDTCERFVRTP